MSDIFSIARTYGDADYYDFNTGKTYLIQEWNKMKRGEIPVTIPGIPIMDPDGVVRSYVPDEDLKMKSESYEEPEELYCSFEHMEKVYGKNLAGKSFICKDGTEFKIIGIDTSGYTKYHIEWIETSATIAGYLSEIISDNEGWYGCGTVADLVGSAKGLRLAD